MGVFFDPQTGAVGWASDTDTSGLQPLDSDLTAIAALTPSNDDVIQRKAGAWTNRTIAQLTTDLGIASTYVPYTGATTNVTLGSNTLSASSLTATSTGFGLDLTNATASTSGIRWRSSLYLYSGSASTLDTNANFQTTGGAADSPTAGSGAIWRQNDGTALVSGDRLGFNLFSATDNGSTFRNAAGFNAYAAGNWSSGVYPTYLNIETSDGTGARVERFRVGGAAGVGVVVNENALDNDSRFEGTTDANLIYTDAGNNRVGIGTATPAAKLDVVGDQQLSGTLYGDTAASGTLILRGTSDSTMGRTDIDKITLFSDSPTITSATNHLIRTSGTITLNASQLGVGTMVMFDPVLIQAQSNTLFGSTLFNMFATYKNDPATANLTLGSMGGFGGQPTITADSQNARQEKQWTFFERTTFSGSGGELYNADFSQYYATHQLLGGVQSGGRVLLRKGFYAEDFTVAGTGIMHRQAAFIVQSQTSARDFNYAWYGDTGLMRHADDFEIDSLGTKGLILHPTVDTRYRYTTKDYTGALQSSEVTFDPFTDIPWYFATDARSANVGGVADLADVTRWNDKSGNGRDLTAGTGTSQPRWENSLALHNNQPAVEFTAANTDSLEYATAATQGAISQGTTYTAVFVVSFKTVAAAQRIFNHLTTATRGIGITATPNWDTRMGGTAVAGGAPAANTLYYVRILGTSTAQTLYATPIATGAETSVATNAVASSTISQIVFGAHKSGVPAYTTPFDGYMSFGAIYAGDLTAHPQYQRFLEYLNTTYGFGLTTTSVAQGTNTHTLATNSNTTAVGNVGTGEDNLITYSQPSSYQSADGDTAWGEAIGSIASNANQKRLKVYFGATALADTGATGLATSTAYTWVAKWRVWRTGAATQDGYAVVQFFTSAGVLALTFGGVVSPTETLSGAVTIKVTGETGAASNNDVVQEAVINGVDGS